MTIPPLPPRMGQPPIRRLPRRCHVLIGNGTVCPHQARYTFPCGDATIDTCPRHGGFYAVLMTGGVSWTETIERAGDE